MDSACCIQAGGWAIPHEVNVEAIKPEILIAMDPTKIWGREAMM